MTGLFITFEGGDGSGKSTQAELLTSWLTDAGHTVVRTREPGGTDLGDELREIVLHRRGDIAPRAEALIYAADRAHHIATKVRPAIERGEVVIQDRYFDSSVAYQGVGRGLGADDVRRISLWAVEDLLPDLTILLDLDESVGARSPRRGTHPLRPARGGGADLPRDGPLRVSRPGGGRAGAVPGARRIRGRRLARRGDPRARRSPARAPLTR